MNRVKRIREALQRQIEVRARSANVNLVTKYVVIGLAWIIGLDLAAMAFALPGESWLLFDTLRGALFVAVTAVLLYAILNRHTRVLIEAESELLDHENRIRQAYVDVLAAVTGGRLVLVSDEELEILLGNPLGTEHRIHDTAHLREARSTIRQSVRFVTRSEQVSDDLLAPVCEALNNALKHGGSAAYQVYSYNNSIQVRVEDPGPGIDFCNLPSAMLVPGYSTTETLGMGFTIILQMCERVLLSTRPGRTVLLLEFAGCEAAPACEHREPGSGGVSAAWS